MIEFLLENFITNFSEMAQIFWLYSSVPNFRGLQWQQGWTVKMFKFIKRTGLFYLGQTLITIEHNKVKCVQKWNLTPRYRMGRESKSPDIEYHQKRI